MNIKYLVASPGRSGSVFITITVARSLGLVPQFDNHGIDHTIQAPSVLHTHDAHIQLGQDTIVVCPYRENLFGEICSAVIAEHYNEWNEYSDNCEPFEVDLDMFEIKYVWHKRWLEAFEYYTDYKNKIYVRFEDFIGNSQKLCNILNIPEVNYVSKPSPRRPEQCLINYQVLLDKFDDLEKNVDLQKLPIDHYDWKDHRKI